MLFYFNASFYSFLHNFKDEIISYIINFATENRHDDDNEISSSI